ncbi:hypothetical protein [Bacteroides stercorirosoris]|uniref:DNA-binding protein n=1 Tax=Bacteroides stercorirosoris TaxID=871324 RepID=A0A1M6L6B5_9BACE|nr:hypothetical protein [Bacteroides stercorirosoris]SHJ66644.1 hypothetical protein SAMN05444350_14442 [Bacteroides stercorirosoris]
MDVFTLKQQITEAAELSALAIAKQMFPAFDDVKYDEAVKIAGSERWLKYHIKKGNILPIRRGPAKNSPIYYSRLDIAATKKAEAEIATLNKK